MELYQLVFKIQCVNRTIRSQNIDSRRRLCRAFQCTQSNAVPMAKSPQLEPSQYAVKRKATESDGEDIRKMGGMQVNEVEVRLRFFSSSQALSHQQL